jgi:pyruvate/2-oxoglutarate dehydrogenase complex dihydrolipoamide dehydrogenase (E3) component
MYDVAIIGGGSAGYAAARTAAAAGLRVAVIEGGAEVGGLCILRGCMPSKALLHSAHVLHLARSAKTWGLRIPKAGFDFAAIMARKKELIDDFAGHRRKELAGGDFKFLRARAEFLDAHTLSLTAPAGGQRKASVPQTISAKHFIIATGSSVAPPPIPGLSEIGYWTSDDALSLKSLPKSLLVLGCGLVGAELAQFFCRLDVKVTLIQRAHYPLSDFDTDAGEVLAKVFRREGIRFYCGTQLVKAFRRGRQKGVSFHQNGCLQTAAAQEILFALGRRPATTGLGLEKLGLTMDDGRIVTNAQMQTSVPHIYAAGDCAGPYEIVHIGVEQGEIAAHNIAHPKNRREIDYRLLTNVAFTDPQAASVGLTEKKARADGIPHIHASYPINDHGKSLIMAALDGFVKLLADPRSGEILGGECVAPTASELIHEIIAAMAKRMTVHELAAMPHYHPTMSEIWTYPASDLAARIK